MSWFLTSGGRSIGTSASASVLPMNIQGWFPLGWTGLISLLSKGLSRVFSSTTIRKHQFFGTQPSFWSNSHICTSLLEKTIVLPCTTAVFPWLHWNATNPFPWGQVDWVLSSGLVTVKINSYVAGFNKQTTGFHVTLLSSAKNGLFFLQQQCPWFPCLEAITVTFIRI